MTYKELYSLFINCINAKYTTVENEGDYCIAKNGSTLYLFFEWTDSATDWKNNFAFFTTPYKNMEESWYCHSGFLKVWKSIESYVEFEIKNPKIENIKIVGYSHGAAIAQLCYEYAKFHRPEIDIEGVGFGAPRVFWGPAPKGLKERSKDFIIVRNGNDIVTHVPPQLFGFRHLGKVLKIGKAEGLILDHYPQRYQTALLELKQKELETNE